MTDAELMAKLNALEKIQLHASVQLEENEANLTYHHKMKMHLINPSILVDGRLITADKLSEKVRKMNRKAEMKIKHGAYIKVIQKSKQ